MNTTTLHRAIAFALAAPLALAACGGGGGGGMVRSSPPPVSPPPAAPPPTSTQRTINEGTLAVLHSQTLVANVTIGPNGVLSLVGTIQGNVTNNGTGKLVADANDGTAYFEGGGMLLFGSVIGDVINHGPLTLSGNPYFAGTAPPNRIQGNFRQSTTGTLGVALPIGDSAGSYPLAVTGHADIDGGTLWLYRAWDWDRGALQLPTKSTGVHVLHADGGVSGTFERWTSPGLFIEGSVRYLANDIWFDLTRVSVQTAMSGQGFEGITLASAGNLDRALAVADGFAATPNTAQSRFLQSAGRLLWLDDAQQAARSLDSLAGKEHAQLAADAQMRASAAAGQLAIHAGSRRMDNLSSRWSLSLASGRIDGYDQWLGPRTLLGGSVAREASTANDASSNEQRASLYLHHRGERWQGTVVASAGRGNGLLQRRIDLGDGQAHVAGTQRRLDLAQLHAELTRPFALAGGELQPYTAIDAGMVRGSGFLEQGDTGFELTSNGGAMHQTGIALGLRYARDWRIGAQRVRLLAELQQAQRLQAGGQWQAAFLGVPDARFDLRDWSDPRSHSARLSLQGGALGGWQWTFSGLRDNQRTAPLSWQLQFARDF